MSLARTALTQLLASAAVTPPGEVVFEEGAPALASRFYAQEACAAVLAGTGVAAADLWTLRGGAAQSVTVETREAAAALTSVFFMRFEDAAQAPDLTPRRLTPANGFFQARDGQWVYLHQSFPDSAAQLHAMMGSPADEAAAARAVAGWDADDLEQAIADAGLCGAIARTPEAWDASEQGRILAATPVVEIVRIGDSPPEPPPAADAPLSGLRVLDLTRVLAGPTCARTLAQYGAETLYLTAERLPSVPAFVADTNHGKRSAFLDLDLAEDRSRLEALVAVSDVFSQGYRPGALERRGFGAARLAQLRPGIVCVDIDAYGHDGPWRGRPGWEQLAQTVTGMALRHGEHQGEAGPKLQPGAVNDYTTGFLGAFGAMVALGRRARWGGSYLVRVSLARTAMWIRSLGLAEPDRAIAPLTPEEIDGWRITSQTGFGPMRHLRPPVRLSLTPTAWRRPLARLGAHPPAWP